MPSLSETLSAIGVPSVTDSDALVAFGDGLLGSVAPADLHDPQSLAEAARNWAPEFCTLAEAAARAEHPDADSLLNIFASTLPTLTNILFLDAVDVALTCPTFLTKKGRELALTLSARIDELRGRDGYQVYSYLEALTRLGLSQNTARYRALEYLDSIDLDDSDVLLERLPKLIGLAIDCWDEASLSTKLELLRENDAARPDATFELAQQRLKAALSAATAAEIMAGLMSARDLFAAAEGMEEVRDDATLYRCVLDVTVAFVAGGPASESLADTASALTASVARHAAWRTRTDLGSWAAPRRQAEAAWIELARTLRSAIDPLAEASWLTPVETLIQVLAAYRASRSITVTTGPGLRVVLEPAIEAAFLRREGLINHLRTITAADLLPEADKVCALSLLAAVGKPAAEAGDAMGKAWAAAPELAAELGESLDPRLAIALAATAEQAPDLVRELNDGARARAKSRAPDNDPLVDDLVKRVLDRLDDCPGLVATARDEFIELLTILLRFAADRANIGRMNGGPGVLYLFKSDDTKPFTEDYLQRDAATWLKASRLRSCVQMEEHDVAAGRADITVTQTHRFTIEVKRELNDVSPAALLKAYGGQAAAYSVTGPAVSLELVLDLTDQSRGTTSLAESVWVQEVPIQNARARHVVTLVIHGNRLTPRQMKAD